MKLRIALLALGAASIIAVPAFAHHSISGAYYMDQRQKIDGRVVEFAFENPHTKILVESADPKTGTKNTWDVEWGSIRRLERQGITKDALKPGDHVILIGYPSRTPGDHGMHVTGIERPSDGWKWGRAID